MVIHPSPLRDVSVQLSFLSPVNNVDGGYRNSQRPSVRLFIVVILTFSNKTTRVHQAKPFVQVTHVTFSLYMLHFPVYATFPMHMLHFPVYVTFPCRCYISLQMLHFPVSVTFPCICYISLYMLHFPAYHRVYLQTHRPRRL